MFKCFLTGAVFHHTCPRSDAESGILPALALNQMTGSHLMEASLSKQTQYTLPLWDPLHRKKEIAAPNLQGSHPEAPSLQSLL